MKALKVVYETKGVYIGKPVDIRVPVDMVLEYGLGPLAAPRRLKRYRIKDKVIEGIAIGENPERVEEFESKHEIIRGGVSKRPGRSYFVIGRTKPVTISLSPQVSPDSGLFLFTHRGNSYLLRRNVGLFVVFKWFESNSRITARLCGKDGDWFFYYLGGSKCTRTLKFTKSVPKELVADFGVDYGYYQFTDRDYEFRESEPGPTWSFVDPLPFPPYEVVGALRLFPPEKVVGEKDGTLPKEFQEVFVLRAVLVLDEPVPVISLSPKELLAFANHITGDIFDPSTLAEYPENEYKELWQWCNHFVLLSKPRWPF